MKKDWEQFVAGLCGQHGMMGLIWTEQGVGSRTSRALARLPGEGGTAVQGGGLVLGGGHRRRTHLPFVHVPDRGACRGSPPRNSTQGLCQEPGPRHLLWAWHGCGVRTSCTGMYQEQAGSRRLREPLPKVFIGTVVAHENSALVDRD